MMTIFADMLTGPPLLYSIRFLPSCLLSIVTNETHKSAPTDKDNERGNKFQYSFFQTHSMPLFVWSASRIVLASMCTTNTSICLPAFSLRRSIYSTDRHQRTHLDLLCNKDRITISTFRKIILRMENNRNWPSLIRIMISELFILA